MQILRQDAVRWISEYNLLRLNKTDLQSLLLDVTCLDENDPVFSILTTEEKTELGEIDVDCIENYSQIKLPFLLLILDLLIEKFHGVSNQFIKKKISEIGYKNEIEIIGEPEILFSCPCCMFLTLKKSGEYNICPVCFWEDDGNRDDSVYSSVNHKTLAEAKENFKKIGASQILTQTTLNPDRLKMYLLYDGK